MVDIIEKELSYLIMQAAYEVHNNLGPGFPEMLYEQAMVRELMSRNLTLQRQRKIVVNYKQEPLGEFILDLTVNERIILELKAVSSILKLHEQQAFSYLKATGLQLAIVINFGAESVQSSRVVNTKSKSAVSPRVPQIRQIIK